MPQPIRVATLLPSIVAGLLVIAASANAQSSTAVFQGLEHTAIGGASLRPNAAGTALEVHTTDPAGGDGVSVHLGEATSWVARSQATGYPGFPLNLTWHAMADGRRISTASLRHDGSAFVLRAAFTGATTPSYSAHVYSDGKLVGSLGGLPPTAEIIVPDGFCDTFGSVGFIVCDFVSEFHNIFDSRCVWGFRLPAPVAIGLPNGARLRGNELRLVEEVRPSGHYPYLTFDAMAVQTNSSPLTLFSELVR